ncbi:MAG TPA: SAM-dependent methyltransferase [Chloroflexi bacterium]|nr:SAM-dependent methyltransferase [Chloroflexota bacterium]
MRQPLDGREENTVTSVDPFGRTDKLDDSMLGALVVRFEARGKHPQFSKMLREYLDAMNIDSADTVLDIGCGTGLAARAIAHRPSFSGRVTGVDLSSYLVAAAERLAHEEGIAERTEFRTGNARSLDVADGTFDAVVVHTLLSHVDDALAVLKEAARVLKVGGMVGIFDGDYASLTFDHADPARGKAYDEALISAVVTNPRIMRQMPRLLRAAGLELVTSFSYVLSEVGRATFWSSAIETYRKLIPKAGVMTEDEADAWAAALRSDSEAGVFFGSSNYYAYVARRP